MVKMALNMNVNVNGTHAFHHYDEAVVSVGAMIKNAKLMQPNRRGIEPIRTTVTLDHSSSCPGRILVQSSKSREDKRLSLRLWFGST